MKTRSVLAVSLGVLVLVAGCAAQQGGPAAPPTVNVTGNWAGQIQGGWGVQTVTMKLRQVDATVTGEMYISHSPDMSGPIQGTVTGNQFSYSVVNTSGGADVTVSENGMTGITRAGNRIVAQRQ